MNSQLDLIQRVLEDYPELLDLFGQYFAQMGNDADYGLIRSLINYMIMNDTPEGLEFVFWAIDYVKNNPNLPSGNVNEELENIYWLEHVYDGELQNNPCTAAVYNKMKNTKTMFKVIKQFMGAAPIAHLEWKIENLSNVNATTRFKPGTNNELVQIRISNNYSNSASPISMARTMLHEALHADVLRKLVSVGGWPINPNVESEFPGLWEYWIKYKNGLNIGEAIGMALHNHMADWYRDKIKQGLIEFDMENGTTHEEWQYEALSWGGLYGTTAWNNLALQNPSLKNQYYNYIQ